MPEFLSPGVYTEEVPSKQQAVQSVSTSTFATVGWLPEGVADKAVLVTSLADYFRKFGGYTKNSTVPLAITAFFQNGGSRAYVVRVTPPDAVAATATLPGYNFAAISKGAWGNRLRVVLQGDQNTFNSAEQRFERFNLLVLEPNDQGQYVEVETFSNLVLDNPESSRYVTSVVNDPLTGSSKIVVTENGGGIPAAFNFTQYSDENPVAGSGGGSQQITGTTTQAPVAKMTFTLEVDDVVVAKDDGKGKLKLVQPSAYSNVSGVVDYTTGTYNAALIPGAASGTTVTSSYFQAGNSFLQADFTGGADGTEVTRAEISDPALSENAQGLYALSAVEELLNIGLPDFPGDPVVAGDLLAYCENNGYCFAILSTPFGADPQDAVAYKRLVLASQSSFGALYYPNIVVPDPLMEGRGKLISNVGHVAGRYAYTDNRRNVGKAPAGQNDGQLQYLLGLERNLNKGEMDLVYPANVNPIIANAAVGRAIYGSRTLQINGDYTQVPWRRLVNFLKKSFYNASQDLVFEPLTEGLFALAASRFTSYMTGLTAEGYFGSRDPAAAFKIICDSTNNTPQTILQRQLIVDCVFMVGTPAEFVRLRFERSLLPLA